MWQYLQCCIYDQRLMGLLGLEWTSRTAGAHKVFTIPKHLQMQAQSHKSPLSIVPERSCQSATCDVSISQQLPLLLRILSWNGANRVGSRLSSGVWPRHFVVLRVEFIEERLKYVRWERGSRTRSSRSQKSGKLRAVDMARLSTKTTSLNGFLYLPSS